MSIKDDEGNEIIHLNSLWSASFKLLLVMVPAVALTLFSWGTWATLTLFDHSSKISVLQDRSGRSNGNGGNINGASINVSKTAEDLAESAREFLTVSEVAEAEGKSDRTILDWIEAGRIHPAPIKTAKEWQISADYRIPPQIAADRRDAKTPNADPELVSP
jgi:hypothetical protein